MASILTRKERQELKRKEQEFFRMVREVREQTLGDYYRNKLFHITKSNAKNNK